jgi:hypothetical protein
MGGMKKPKGAVKCKMVSVRAGSKKVKRCWDKKGKFVKTGATKKKR